MNSERLTLVEIIPEDGDRSVKSFHAYSVPAVGETINWASKHKVEVLARDWVIDAPTENPAGNLRCVLICRKIVWDGKPVKKRG
jgi:hypothetical protein